MSFVDFIELLSDVTNDAPTKSMVGGLISKKFSPNSTSQALQVIHRTLILLE